ncbi:MAG: HAMP domain-containing sensor histidine kinase [Pseudomonadota bacterium]
MWKKLPLNLRIILPLVMMQIAAMTFGIGWLTSWLESSRMRQLENILDTQTDVVEDAIEFRDEKLQFEMGGELVKEINADKNYYFAVLTTKGDLFKETDGPSASVRDNLRSQLISLKLTGEKIAKVKVNQDVWLVFREIIDREMLKRENKAVEGIHENGRPIGYLYAATNAGPMMTELAFVKRTIILGLAVLLALITLSTAIIVSSMTSNLKKFVQSLEHVKPENPQWKPPSEPNSLEEHLLFARFHEMMASIQKTTEAQRLFIANASHELKTPIAGIMMSLEVMLSKRRSQEEYEANGKKLLLTVKSLKRLSSAMLDISKISEPSEVVLSAVEVSEIFDSLLTRWGELAYLKNIKVAIDPKSNPATINSNRDLIEIALGCFIDNAIKYSDANGQVQLFYGIESGENRATIRIKDCGIGMNEEDKGKLGQVFFRSNLARSDDTSYGLGYAQALRIISILGGRVDVNTSLGEGTTITVNLPLIG